MHYQYVCTYPFPIVYGCRLQMVDRVVDKIGVSICVCVRVDVSVSVSVRGNVSMSLHKYAFIASHGLLGESEASQPHTHKCVRGLEVGEERRK